MSEPYQPDETREAEDRLEASQRLEADMARVIGQARSQDGLVAATVNASGELVQLWLDPAAVNLGADRLGQAITETARQAAEFAVQRSYNVLARALGDEFTAVVEAVGGTVPARAAGWDSATVTGPAATPGRQAAQPAEDEDVFSFDLSSLRSDR
ncbi:YbaB/EbfC family nucleoid-associated protein [Crossiella sp. CA-258035]|uniref:YbaB/EbfC family nucleoid-associated protein n=1 Tax=Crossiella sp. CA-258035 TaxID=2981138 RepID=UPI0024BCE925|nr:YbaB/EbfC family nucleoid-associated protein [Crossiella sp. CA-258035]WHT20278.1 YbaB/EbfC family nucleoid-associated protein [Crossiella sp. CA-258035]